MANMVRTNDAVVRSRECAPPLSWRRQRGLRRESLFVQQGRRLGVTSFVDASKTRDDRQTRRESGVFFFLRK